MKVTIDIPNTEVIDIIDFLCEVYDYPSEIYSPVDLTTIIANPETKKDFAERHLIRPLKQGFDKWLIRRAVKSSDVESKITIDSVVI